jgi:hypothetical protein
LTLAPPPRPSSAQPANLSPIALGNRNAAALTARDESFAGLRLRSWIFAILIEIGSNDRSQVVQHSGRPHEPYPPSILASSRTPIWRISIRLWNSAASSRTSSRKSTRPSAVK